MTIRAASDSGGMEIIMDNQNTNDLKSDYTSNLTTRKKKIGCLGCFGFLLLTIVIIGVVFFTIKVINKKIEEKEEKKLKDRFSYIEKVSAEDKITQAFKKGEISTDTYILQLAYSIFEKNKVDPLYVVQHFKIGIKSKLKFS